VTHTWRMKIDIVRDIFMGKLTAQSKGLKDTKNDDANHKDD